MTPRDKAIELRDWYCKSFGLDHVAGCMAAIKLADEVITVASTKVGAPGSTYSNPGVFYWRQVKTHLEKYNNL